MIYGELNWLNIDIITYNVCRKNMSLVVINESTRGIQDEILCMLIVRLLCQIITTMRLQHLPVIQPAQKYQHAEANQQEDEHLPVSCPSQFFAHAARFLSQMLVALCVTVDNPGRRSKMVSGVALRLLSRLLDRREPGPVTWRALRYRQAIVPGRWYSLNPGFHVVAQPAADSKPEF